MKIVILDGYASNPGDVSWQELADLGELTVYDRTAKEDVVSRIADAEIVFLNKTPVDAAVFDACPRLKMIGILATGYNIVDIAAAKAHGVPVCNVPGYSTGAVAQMTFALLLEMTQCVGGHSAAVHAGQWQNCPDFCFWNAPLSELSGKTMGLIGYGAIGQAVGRIAQAFGMHLLVTARHEKPVPEGAEFVALDELLARSDVVSLHCPQTAENLHMIGAAALAKMKDGAILLNTARGGLIDEHHAGEVDAEHAVPAFQRHIAVVVRGDDTGVAVDKVDLAIGAEHLSHHGADGVRIADVAAQRDAVRPEALVDLFGVLQRTFEIDVDERDICAQLCQRGRRAAADAAGGAGHEAFFALKGETIFDRAKMRNINGSSHNVLLSLKRQTSSLKRNTSLIYLPLSALSNASWHCSGGKTPSMMSSKSIELSMATVAGKESAEVYIP